jgi:uncharacterized protein YkwD
MKKMLAAAVVAILGTGLLPGRAWADAPSDEGSFVVQINALRADRGLPRLRVDAGLQAKARAWARTMADKGTIWHSVLSDGITVRWQRLGENVGMGGDVDSLHRAFVASPHHYENLVNANFDRIGVGVVRDASGTLFVAEEFMQTGPAPSVTPAAPMKAPPVKATPAKKARPGKKARRATKARRR